MNVFLSYENRNREFIDFHLVPFLKLHKVDPLIIDLQLVIGAAIDNHRDLRLRQILRDCDYVIAVLSKEYARSRWLQKELLAFQRLEAVRGADMLLPIIINNCRVPPTLEERICADFRASIEVGLGQLEPCIVESRKIFVVMKFGDEVLNSAYERVVKPVFERAGYAPLRIDERKRSSRISTDILDEIRRSEVIYADLTGKRPNCYYEAGYAQALGKEVVLAIRKEDFPPEFDLNDYRFIIWDSEKELEAGLRDIIDEIRRGTAEMHTSKAGVAPEAASRSKIGTISPNKSAAPDANRTKSGRRR